MMNKDMFLNFAERERTIDALVEELAKKEGMNPNDILSDIVTFAPYEGNEALNVEYLEQVAELLGITSTEMTNYALKKAKDFLGI